MKTKRTTMDRQDLVANIENPSWVSIVSTPGPSTPGIHETREDESNLYSLEVSWEEPGLARCHKRTELIKKISSAFAIDSSGNTSSSISP